MSYYSKSIQNIVKDIEFEKAYLPAIQRKFVWPRWKIEQLFDSLLRGYPISSFLFWELKSEKANDYVFYSFLKNYDERKPNNIRKSGAFLHPEIIGVLDGQQRLSSMYLGLQGSHRERLKHHRSFGDHAYPETFMYLNLLSLPYEEVNGELDINRDINFEFRFLTLHEASQINHRNENGEIIPCLWFKTGTVLQWSEDPDIDSIYDALQEKSSDSDQQKAILDSKRFIKKALRDLHIRICDEKLINYFKVTKDDLDDILKIFIRVNSGGTILSKTDLLFSTIVATWEDGRDEIEAFIKSLNSKGDRFSFNNDFLMRACLVLSDLPVLFKVNSFKSENVELIKNNWAGIKCALTRIVDLLVSFGFNSSVLTSQNAIIILAYHYMKGGSNSEASKQAMRMYLLHASLKNVYGGQGDQVIASFRNYLRVETTPKKYQLKSAEFDFSGLLGLKLPANKTLKISEEDVDDFLLYRKGANSFFVLSLLYPNLRFNQVHFHQDHIHPDSGFSESKLKSTTIDPSKWAVLREIKDTIPNLQIMEGRQNESKNSSAFKIWVNGQDSTGRKNVSDLSKFCADNYIPETIDFEFNCFEDFYNERKKLIKKELKTVLQL